MAILGEIWRNGSKWVQRLHQGGIGGKRKENRGLRGRRTGGAEPPSSPVLSVIPAPSALLILRNTAGREFFSGGCNFFPL